ncbi:MAG: efflux RND transporter periplasmic adaptor subunit [Verrucomicrobiales bacterium]
MKSLKSIAAAAIVILLGIGAWVMIHNRQASPEEEQGEVVTEVAVKATKLIKTTLHRRVIAFGLVEPEPATGGQLAGIAKLAVPSSGLIAEVNCSEGQRVDKGAVLVSLDTRVDQSRVDQAKAAVAFADQELGRQKKLLEIDGASIKTFQAAQSEAHKARLELAAAETALSMLRIEAPIPGIVTMVNARRGEAADPTVTAIELLDPTRLILTVRIPAASAAEVITGQSAALYREGKTLPFESAVTYVSPLVDPLTGAVEVRLSIAGDAAVRPGEWLEARIVSAEKPDVFAVPVESLTTTEEEGPVIALINGDTATQVPVTTGVRESGLVEVAGDGLKEGGLVVTEGAYGLPHETKVRVLDQ